MIDVVVAGAAGRMGSRIVACLQGDADLKLAAPATTTSIMR